MYFFYQYVKDFYLLEKHFWWLVALQKKKAFTSLKHSTIFAHFSHFYSGTQQSRRWCQTSFMFPSWRRKKMNISYLCLRTSPAANAMSSPLSKYWPMKISNILYRESFLIGGDRSVSCLCSERSSGCTAQRHAPLAQWLTVLRSQTQLKCYAINQLMCCVFLIHQSASQMRQADWRWTKAPQTAFFIYWKHFSIHGLF